MTQTAPDHRPALTLPRALRLKSSAQFQNAKRRGDRVHTPHLIVYLVDNRQHPTRLGVTVSKKVGKAHQRAYMKRLIREAFRQSSLRQSSGFDVSIIAKRGVEPPKLHELITQLNQLAQRSAKRRSPERSSRARRSRNDHSPPPSKRAPKPKSSR